MNYTTVDEVCNVIVLWKIKTVQDAISLLSAFCCHIILQNAIEKAKLT